MLEAIKKKFSDLKKDKTVLSILLLIIVLGLVVRVMNYDDVGYWNDDMTTVPAGLLWFYPHSYYPGLSGHAEPQVGNIIIGLGCMLSGEDFSGVSKIQPTFYPGREFLLGEAMTNAEAYCKAPILIFGILFFFAIIILAFTLLEKYSALFVAAFFAFQPTALLFSRFIHVDIISWFFVASALLFLWLAFIEQKSSKNECVYFTLAFIFIALALATKLSTGIFLLFGFFILLRKYFTESLGLLSKLCNLLSLQYLKKYNKEEFAPLIKNMLYSGIAFTIAFLMPFKFNPKNLLDVYSRYSQFNPETSASGLNLALHKFFFNHVILNTNIFDTLLFFFAIFIVVKIAMKKRTKLESFILYLNVLLLLTAAGFNALHLTRIAYPYLIGTFLLMSLAFSKNKYALFDVDKRKVLFIFLILIYISFSFLLAFKNAPYFNYKNGVVCMMQLDVCNRQLWSLSQKHTAQYMSSVLNDDETFYSTGRGIIYYYVRREDPALDWQFYTQAVKQLKRDPSLPEIITNFKPMNRTIRYVLVQPTNAENMFVKNYIPNHVVKAKGFDSEYVFDLKNLRDK